jgi:signal peptidase I
MTTATETKKRGGPLRGIVEFVGTIAFAIGAALLIQAFLVKPYKIPSLSMYPTLHVGQRILVNRLSKHPGVGDIVVFHPPAGSGNTDGSQCANPSQGPGEAQPCDAHTATASSETYVKRVVGLPGDTLKIRGGHVYRNGVEETGSYIRPCPETSTCTFSKTIKVPQGEYYMMGDNRGDSDDSRYWGPVPQRWIIGEAFFTYWPLGRVGTL